MNIATVIAFGETVIKYGKAGVKYLKDDYSHWTGLDEPVTIEVYSKGIGRFNFENATMKIRSPHSDCVILHSEAFKPDTHYWNLASIIKDAKEKGGENDGRDEASLFHDLIDTFNAEIAKANNTTSKDVSDWSDGILAIIWRSYGKKKGKDGWWLNLNTKAALNVCRSRLRGLWGRIVGMIVVALSCLLISGCDDVPEGYSTTPDIHYTTTTNATGGAGE